MNKLRKHSSKGFTLIELIVVIVIIAILVAALTPAILGVIERANIAADEADCRSVMMAGSVAALSSTPPKIPTAGAVGTPGTILGEITATTNIYPATYTVYFDGPVAVGCSLKTPGRSKKSSTANDLFIGNKTPTGTNAVDVTITASVVVAPSA